MAVDQIEKAIVSVLRNNGNVAGLVGTRIYPHEIPQSASVPAITYKQTSGERDHTMDGPSGFASPEYEITCWDDSYGTPRVLARYVRTALDGYKGTVGTVVIHIGMLGDELDVFRQLPDIKSTKRYGKQLTFKIWHDEATS